jgi:alkanesulfonate monooxygenase SsuD/methylene tetrahydromethanopterin reductase-like flavin-dependent oxidoreductase (luciferase family)
VATHSPQVLRLCGRLADGVLLANMARRPAVERAIGLLREGEVAAGRAPGSVAVHLRLETCISDDEEGAVAAVRQRVASRVMNSYPRWDYLTDLDITPTDAMRKAAEARDLAALAAQLSADDVRATTLTGSVEGAVRQLGEVLTPDVHKVTIRPVAFPGQRLDATVSRFIEQVWPAVRSRLGPEPVRA